MVNLETVRATNAALAQRAQVAVFVGATSGIGEHTVHALASIYSNAPRGHLRVYLVGRNAEAAGKIIATCQKTCQEGDFRFVQATDLSLLRDVDQACDQIVEQEGKINGGGRVDLLVMSQARSVFESPKVSSEGIEHTMSLYYYSRMRFVDKLVPLLLASPTQARIISIYAPGSESTLHVDDLPLLQPQHKDSGYFLRRSHCVYMKTCYFESLAERHGGKLGLIHVFSGLIETPSLTDPVNPWWFKMLWTCTRPFLSLIPVAMSQEEVGRRIMYLAGSERFIGAAALEAEASKAMIGTNGRAGSGAYAIDNKGEIFVVSKAWKGVNKDDLKKKVWDHTTRVFQDIENKGAFRSSQ